MDEFEGGCGEAEHGLVMPFVTVRSKGGPYDDASYAAGWAMGVLDERLSCPWLRAHTETVRLLDVPQAELVAMKNGFTTQQRECGVDEWVYMDFVRSSEAVLF